MNDPSLPAFANALLILSIIGNVATAWVVLITMAQNKGNLYSSGPPWLAVLSAFSFVFAYYKILLPIEVSFWLGVVLAMMGLWGAYVDYTHLADHKKTVAKPRGSLK